jgi:hypothetical protein
LRDRRSGLSCFCEAGKETNFFVKMDENNGDIETAERPPQLDLYEPLIGDKERAVANGNGNTNHLAMIGAKVSPIESLDYEYLAPKASSIVKLCWVSIEDEEIILYHHLRSFTMKKWRMGFFFFLPRIDEEDCHISHHLVCLCSNS